MTDLINRITAWLATAWLFIKRNWPIIVPVAAVALALAAVTATTTLRSCGCQGPVPTPTVIVTPSPTPIFEPPQTPTPIPGAHNVVTGTHELHWDTVYNVSPGAFDWGWDKDCHLVVIDAASGQVYTTTCGGVAYHYTASYVDGRPYRAVCTGGLSYVYVIDIEVRQDGAVVRGETITTTLTGMAADAGTPCPTTGQYDGGQPWKTSLAGLTGRLEVWARGQWVPNCDELPTVTAYREGDGGLVAQDEQGFSLVGVYER